MTRELCHCTALQGLATQVQTAQTALQTAVKSNSGTGINSAATTIGNLTAQQVTAQATAQAAFYAILTGAQQTIYNTYQLAGFDGPGGPGGGRGPGGPR